MAGPLTKVECGWCGDQPKCEIEVDRRESNFRPIGHVSAHHRFDGDVLMDKQTGSMHLLRITTKVKEH